MRVPDIRLVVTLASIAASAVLTVALHFHWLGDATLLHRGGYAALFTLGLIGGVTLFLPVPVLPIIFAGGGTLDPWLVTLAGASGMTIGMGVTYFMGTMGRGLFRDLAVKPRSGRFSAWSKRSLRWYAGSGVTASFLLAVIPNPIYDFAGILAGSVRVPLHRFLVGTMLGKSAQTLGVAMAGFVAAGRL